MKPYHTLSNGERRYTVKQAANYLGVHPMTIYQWKSNNTYPMGALQNGKGKTILFTQDELDNIAIVIRR